MANTGVVLPRHQRFSGTHGSTLSGPQRKRGRITMETRHNNSLPPVIILGGNANAVSIARSLGRAGILVYAINVPQEAVRYSRFTRWISIPRRPGSRSESWANYLLGPESDHLR